MAGQETKPFAQNGWTFAITAATHTGKWYGLYKGNTTGCSLTSAKDENGTALSAAAIAFINDEVANGQFFPIKLTEVVVASGEIALAIG